MNRPVAEEHAERSASFENNEGAGADEALLMTAARGGAFGFVGSVGAKVLGLILQVLVSRLYGAHYYGLFVTGVIFCILMEVISGLGLQKGSMRFLAIAHERGDFAKMRDIFQTALIFPFAVGILIGTISYSLAPWVAAAVFKDPEMQEVLRQFSYAVPFMALLRTGSDLSRAFKITTYSVIIEDLLFSLIHIFLFIVLYSLGYGFFSVTLSFMFSSIICSALMVVMVGRLIRRFMAQTKEDRRWSYFLMFPKDWQSILVYSLPLMPMGLVLIGDEFTDIIMLGILSDSRSVGEYAAAAKWVTLFFIIARPMYMIFTPMMAGQFGSSNTDQIELLYRTAIRWTFFLTFPAFIFLLMAREPVMLLFGKGFIHSGPTVLAILLLGSFFTMLTGNAGNLLAVSGHQYKELTCLLGSLILNVLMNIWLIPICGIYGAALSTIVSNLACDAGRVLFVRQYFRMHPFTRHYVAPVLVGLASCAAVMAGSWVWEPGAGAKLTMALGASCLVALSIVTMGLDAKDRELFFMLRKKVFSRLAFGSQTR